MTEVPDHLLRRSRERREALGLDAGEGEPAGGAPSETPAAAGTPSTEVAARPAAAAAVPAAPRAAAVAVPDEPAPEPEYIKVEALRRSKNPLWVMPVLIGLPLWAYFYAFAFSPPKKTGPVDPLVLGAEIYHGKGACSGCHGANGEGVGVYPKLQGGDAAITFPNVADQLDWVRTGSASKPIGTPYGDAKRVGGQHKVKYGVMPAFAGTLTDAEIAAVVQYEREKL